MVADFNQAKKDTAYLDKVVRDGYKKTEVGVIPKDWEIKKIEDLFVFLSTSSCSRSDLNSEGEAYYIHYGDIHTKLSFILDFDKEDIPKIELKKVKTATPLIDGDLIFVDASEDEEGSGKAIEIKNVGEKLAVAGLHTIAIRSKTEEIANGFKTYIQEFPSFKQQIRSLITGIKVYAISKTSLATIKIPIPPLPEQRAIAEALSDVDGLIAALDKLIAKKKAIKQAAKQQLLTGKVRLPGFQKKAGYKKTEVGVIPEDWEIKSFPEVCWFQEGPGLRQWQFTDSGMKVINVTNLENGVLNLERTDRYISLSEFNKMYKHFAIDTGDIVMASSGNSYGKTAIVRKQDLPLMMNTSVIRFKPLKKAIRSYIWAFLNSSLFKKQIDLMITGGAQPNFGPYHLKRVLFPTPNKSEQEAIATILSDMEAEIQALERRREKVKQIKQGMMQKLLTGRVRLVK